MTTPRREEVVRIARRLKSARENVRPKLSQRAAAAAIRVSVRTLQDWEQGKHPPPAPRVADLAQLYRVSADYIVGLGSDELPPYRPAEPSESAEAGSSGAGSINRMQDYPSGSQRPLHGETNGHRADQPHDASLGRN